MDRVWHPEMPSNLTVISRAISKRQLWGLQTTILFWRAAKESEILVMEPLVIPPKTRLHSWKINPQSLFWILSMQEAISHIIRITSPNTRMVNFLEIPPTENLVQVKILGLKLSTNSILLMWRGVEIWVVSMHKNKWLAPNQTSLWISLARKTNFQECTPLHRTSKKKMKNKLKKKLGRAMMTFRSKIITKRGNFQTSEI